MFEKSIVRAQKKEKKYTDYDNRFAVFRLFSTIFFLALSVSYVQNHRTFLDFFSAFSLFLFYCCLLSFFHKKIQATHIFWQGIVKSYQLSKARVERDFQTLKNAQQPWHESLCVVPSDHLYASDIDLHKELFLWLDTCSTFAGSAQLFALLLKCGQEPLGEDDLKLKRELVASLVPHTALLRNFECQRLKPGFFTNTHDFNADSLNTPHEFKKIKNVLACAFINSAIWGLLFVPAFFKYKQHSNPHVFIMPAFLYAVVILLSIGFLKSFMNQAQLISKLTAQIEVLIKALKIYSHKGEKNNFQKLCDNFTFLEPSSLKVITRLNRVLGFLSLRGNMIFWAFVHIFLPFDALFSLCLYFTLKKIEKNLSIWQREMAHFDVLASFARVKVENPEFQCLAFEKKEHVSFENALSCVQVENLGHPLLPYKARVGNSLRLTKDSSVVLLTGSNMAGKSTFLRAFATNMLLYNMGAPVCARNFLVPHSKIFCAIRLDDSLSEGTSYFYAEVKRIALILSNLKSSHAPALFFIDEIFKGTNNKERYQGALGILKNLISCGHFGFVSTHDLALADLAHKDTRLRNMHFADRIEDDALVFDYLLKEGSCPTTNALFIMKKAGLNIEI